MLLWRPLYVSKYKILNIHFILLRNYCLYFDFIAIKIHFAEKLET